MHMFLRTLLAVLAASLLGGCGGPGDVAGRPAGKVVSRDEGAAGAGGLNGQRRIIPQPSSWACWLQHADPEVIAMSDAQLVVVDYSRDGSDAQAFSRADVARMQEGGRTVLCYFSIGEAESYRFYWQPEWKDAPPSFLGPENPDWPENFKVRYWQEQWWNVALQPYLDRILAAGFDGVYLDIVDAYWYWHEEGGRDLAASSTEMMRLVTRVAQYLREHGGPNRIVCPQNGEGLLNDGPPEAVARYLRRIDMVGVESLFFNVTPESAEYRRGLLKRMAEAGKTVLNMEYITLDRVTDYRRRAADLSFPIVCYRAEPDAALNSLAPQTP